MADASHPTIPGNTPSHPTVAALPPGVAAAPPSQRLGRYVLGARLGAGGMGEVWKAWDSELGRWAALKFLRSSDHDEVLRLRREAQTAATLSHPNIISVHEVADIDGRPFIAMQYVDGQTLESYPRHDPRALVALIRDAALAVHHAHGRGVIHRDLKPANLMVERDSNRLFVMDFGLAKQTSVASTMSVSGMAVGTPAYMPPEQASGRAHDVDARSDVYGLGATLYELLTDRVPFKGDDLYSLLLAVIESDPPPLRRVKPSVDPDLETIVLKCLENDRARRYPTAAALADDLTRWLAGETVTARAPSVAYRVRKFVGKRRLATALVAGLTIALVAASFLARGLWTARGAAAEAALYDPIEKDLDHLRMKFYRREFRLTDDDFARYDALITRLSEQAATNGDSPRGCYLIGRCREILCDLDGADAAYTFALRLDPDHAPSLLALGRLRIERAVFEFVTVGEAWRDRRAIARAEAAAGLIERGSRGRPSMAADLARCYLHVVRNWRKGSPGPGRALYAQWRHEPFAEELLLTSGMTGANEDIWTPASEAITRMPAMYLAYFWRSIAVQTDAEADLARAIEIHPRFAQAYVQRGCNRFEREDYPGATVDFEAALKLSPGNPGWCVNLAEAHRKFGNLDPATAAIERALALRPEFADAVMVRAQIASARGDLPSALRDADRAIALDPASADLRCDRAQLRILARDFSGALSDAGRALELAPELAEAVALRANAKRLSGDLTGALTDIESSAARDADASSLLARAWIQADRGDLEAAVADARRALKLRPKNNEVLSQAAEILYKADLLAEAKEVYDRCLALGAPQADDHAGRGIVLEAMGDRAGAAADFEQALAINPRCAPALLGRAMLRVAAGAFEDALRDFDAGIAADPKNASAFRLRGNTWDKLGRPDLAVADYDQALKLNPRDLAALNNRGHQRLLKGDLEGALEDINRAIAISPTLAEAWINRGAAHHQLGRNDDAIEDFSRAIQLDPARGQSWFNRGSLRRLRGDRAGAISDLTKAIALDPAAHAYYSRALAHQENGDFKTALADHDAALALTPGFVDALANRGLCHRQLGDRAKARADFQEALRLAPENWGGRAQVERMLREL